MSDRRFLLILMLLCIPARFVWSQSQNLCNSNPGGTVYCDPPQTGITTFGSFSEGGLDAINRGNLNINITIPVFSRAGRGLNLSYALAYNSWIWYPTYSTVLGWSGMRWQPVANWGWSTETQPVGQTQLAGYYTYQQTQPGTCSAVPLAIMYTQWAYYDTLGTAHNFPVTLWSDSRCGGTSVNGVLTKDGSGYQITAQTTPSVSATILSRSGTTLTTTANSSTLTDSNGNTITFNGSAFYDTQSSTTPALTVSTQSNSITYTYTNEQGGPSTVTVNYSPYTVQTNSGCAGFIEYPATQVSLVSSITLPDQSQYLFTYQATPGFPNSVTGRMHTVQFPTGAVYTYNYPAQYLLNATDTSPTNGPDTWCVDGTSDGLQRITPDGTWNYLYANEAATRVQDPSSTISLFEFGGAGNDANVPFQTTVWPTGEGVGATNPLLVSRTYYNGCTWWNSACTLQTPFTQIGITHELNATLDSSLDVVSSFWAETDLTYNLSGAPLKVMEYDFGTNAAGALLREADIGGYYAWDRPTSVTVKNGGGTIQKQTTYSYDQYSLQSSGANQLGPPLTSPRGNPTTISSLVQGSSSLSQTIHYYDSGQVYTSQDVNGATTTYTDSACGDSFPATISSQNLSYTIQWDCYGAVPTSITDPNGAVTTTAHNDPYFRWTKITDPLTNVTTASYTPTSMTVSQTFNGGQSVHADTITTDSQGRPHLNQVQQGPGSSNYNSTETDYYVSQMQYVNIFPYVAGLGVPNSSGPGLTTSYDALGRILQTTNYDGGYTKYQYTNNDVLITVGPAPNTSAGDNLKQRQLQYDALGRLTSVCEITSTANGGTSCGQNQPSTGFLTTYQYDSLGDLTEVYQGSQSRNFTYDAIGRLTSGSDPESAGGFAYTYDSDSTCGSYPGDLVKKVDAVGNVTCFSHDNLHRLTAILPVSGPYTYNNTYSKCFVYDAASVPSGTGQGTSLSNTKGRLAYAWTGADLTCTNTNSSNQVTWNAMSYGPRGELVNSYSAESVSYGIYQSIFSYYTDGSLQTLTPLYGLSLPSFTYSLDPEGRIYGVSGGSTSPLNWTTYNASNEVTKLAYGSGDSSSYAYDSAGRMTVYQFTVGSPYKTDIGLLTWNPNGSLGKLAITNQFNSSDTQTCNYLYDDLSRIANANCGAIWAQTFTYDRYGNISKSGNASWLPTYSPTTNRMTQLPGGYTPSYDANGNTLADSFHTYLWSSYNQPTIIDASSSWLQIYYDAFGRPAMRCTQSACTEVVYGPAGKLALMNGQTVSQVLVPLPGGARAVYQGTTLSHWRHPDWLGSARFSSTVGQTMYYSGAYAPYGETYAELSTPDRSYASHDQNTEPSSTNGLYDAPARELEQYGRWISPDPARLAAANPADPQSWNRYAYVRNSPLNMIDPLGLDSYDPYAYVFDFAFIFNGLGASIVGPLSFGGPFGDEGDDDSGFTFCCGNRQVATPIFTYPSGGPPRVKIPGPAYRVMSGDVQTPGMALFHGPGMASFWNATAVWVNGAAIGTGAAIVGPWAIGAGIPALGAAAQSIAFGPAAEAAAAGTGGSYVFYSGPGTKAAAEAWSALNNGTMIGMTEFGQAIENGTMTVEAASEAFANSARGTIQLFSNAPFTNFGNVWFNYELPALANNPYVTNLVINFVDPVP